MRTLVAVPCMDMVHSLFLKSILGMNVSGDVEFSLGLSSLIYDSRNRLAHKAVEDGFDRILWLDSDMLFAPDLFNRLSAWLDEGYEMMSGIYYTRKEPIKPVIYKSCCLVKNENGDPVPDAKPYLDFPKDRPFEVAAHGFGAVMMTTKLVKDVADEFGLPFSPVLGFGEDLSFCMRVQQLGRKMFCDPAIKLGHIAYVPITEQIYERMQNNEIRGDL